MGLTIHYQLHTPLTKATEIRTLVETLREFARDLPFQEVDDIVEFRGQEANAEPGNHEDEQGWLKIQASRHLSQGERYYAVAPTHIIAFSTWPGEGCEEANFGFCRYPASILCPSGSTKRLRTQLQGWSWSSFCKTQYASNPECGGLRNFLRCHLGIVKLLDFAKSTGLITVEVRDEGDYWESRDPEKLALEVGQMNEFVAAFAGTFKDEAARQGTSVEAAIADFPNFEHLEAKGQARLAELRARHDKPAD